MQGVGGCVSGRPGGGVWGGGGGETGIIGGIMMAGRLDPLSHKASSSPSTEGENKDHRRKAR